MNKFEQLIEYVINDEDQKARELFHDIVVAKSREIYENLMQEEAEEDLDEAEVNEADDSDDDETDDEELDEGAMGGDASDDLIDEIEADEEQDMSMEAEGDDEMGDDEMGDDEGGDFGGDDMGGDDMGGDEEEMKDGFDLATVREYVEKVPAGHGAEKKGQGEKADGSAGGLKFSKNDMGGTAANILGGKNGSDAGQQGMSGDLKGSGLSKGKPQLQDGGNVNTPGAKNGNAFSTKEPGHGAEKAGSKESADKGAAGLFRGRR
jgi:hypothetical protein